MVLGDKKVKPFWLYVLLVICFASAIVLLMVLDFFNLESISLFNERGFYFDYTWKGRLFLLFFVWLFVLECFVSIIRSSKQDLEPKPRSLFRVLVIFLCALIPLIYVFSVNFLGLNHAIIDFGDVIRGDYWRANSEYWMLILEGDWPITLEYVVFTFSFLATILLAYGKDALKKFPIPLALIGGISVIYLIDVFFPYGVFKPLQLLALPTAACAAIFLDIMGYVFTISYSPAIDSMPLIRTTVGGEYISIGIAWPCAGVHSLFLFSLIILLLFKNVSMSSFRKLVYFVIGLIGTYLVNVLRIIVYFLIRVNDGLVAAQTFHNVFGELLFVVWTLLYILLIVCIQKFGLIEKTTNTLNNLLGSARKKGEIKDY